MWRYEVRVFQYGGTINVLIKIVWKRIIYGEKNEYIVKAKKEIQSQSQIWVRFIQTNLFC